MNSKACVYGSSAGCSDCKFVVYSECEKFRKLRAWSLVSALYPFPKHWDHSYKPYKEHNVIYALTNNPVTVAKMKCAAANYSLESSKPVIRITTEKLLNRVLVDTEEFEPGSCYYLELRPARLQNKEVEVLSCIETFINRAEDAGCKCFVITTYRLSESAWFQIK